MSAGFRRRPFKPVRYCGDPRPSLQELYGNHQGFVNAVTKAAAELVKERFLLEVDADADISAAQASTVLN